MEAIWIRIDTYNFLTFSHILSETTTRNSLDSQVAFKKDKRQFGSQKSMLAPSEGIQSRLADQAFVIAKALAVDIP